MSLRSKVVGTLLGVFVLYVLAAWFVLSFVYTPAFNKLEHSNSSDQLLRVHEFIEAEKVDVDLLVADWAEWDDTMHFVNGDYDDYIEENLSDAYLAELGMSFVSFLKPNGDLVWAEAYPSGGDVASIDYLFPRGINKEKSLLSPLDFGKRTIGLINTAQGLAVLSSARITWSSGDGSPGGLMIVGRLLDEQRIQKIGQTVLSELSLIPASVENNPPELQEAIESLLTESDAYIVVNDGQYLNSLKLLKDINGENVAILNVRNEAHITALGTSALNMTIMTLVFAAAVVTAVLWSVLNGALLRPIELLTDVLRGGTSGTQESKERELVSTVRRLSASRGSISKRNDEIGQLVSAFDDLSSSLKEATNSVWRIAHLDGLTSLANRRLVMEYLDAATEKSTTKQPLAVLFIDLDDFKKVNDQMGHEVGDKLLVEVSDRIQAVVGNGDGGAYLDSQTVENLVGRMGGDEFVVLLSSPDDISRSNAIAAEIVDTVASPYYIDGKTCVIGACVGVALWSDDTDSVSELLANADLAMYEAKKAGKNTWRQFTGGSSQNMFQRSA